MTETFPLTPAALGRRALRGTIGLLLGRAARTVLLSREIAMANGSRQRWLASDVRRFRAALPGSVAALRPHARFDDLRKFGNRLMVELAVLTVAAHRVLLDQGVGPDEARALVADLGWIVYARMLRLSSLPVRTLTRDPGRRLRWTIRMLLLFPFGASGAPGYAVQTGTEDANILTYFTHCPPLSFVRRLVAEGDDRGDLQAFRDSWCRYDWPGADIIADDGLRGHYRRGQTLSHGDPVCDMCWIAHAATDRSNRPWGLEKPW